MTGIEILLALAVLVGVGGAGWLLGRGHGRTVAALEREMLQARLVAAETRGDEVLKQLSQRELETEELRQGLSAERLLRAQTDARSEALRQNLETQQALLAEAQARLGETFKALSADALRESNVEFLKLAQETLGRRQDAVEGAVRPLQEALQRYGEAVRELEAKRERAYGGLAQQLETLARSSTELQREAGNLVTALRMPHVRGRWGELTLHRVVELAGMTAHCDYLEQVSVDAEGGRLRPDMVVNLPAGRQIVVDAKVPLTAYLDAVGAPTVEERRAALARHAQQMRQHMLALAAKAYWEEFGGAAELVVMFIPGEAFVGAAAEADPALIEDGMRRRVVVATPTTLVALLRAIAYGWRQEQVAENAERLRRLGQELYERIRVMLNHLDDVGDKLGKATSSYNKAVASLESRVLPAARRFRDLGAGTGADLPTLAGIDEQPRTIEAPEVPHQLDVTEGAP